MPMLEHGFSLLPVGRGSKVPTGPWAHAQSERASMADVALWLDEGANLGVATGQLSGVVVVDCDNAAAVARLSELGHEPTPMVLTGRGAHAYFRHPGQPVKNAVSLEPGIDVRGDGGYCIVPPSVHANGERYAWATGLSLTDLPLAPLPAWLLRSTEAQQTGRTQGEWGRMMREVVGSGQRNQRLAELSGYLLRKYVDVDAVEALMLCWNFARCEPAMSPGEVRRTVRSIAEREARRRAQ